MPNDADRAGTPAGVFGAELRFYRTRASLSQKDLAAKANVSHDVISKIETRERPPAEDPGHPAPSIQADRRHPGPPQFDYRTGVRHRPSSGRRATLSLRARPSFTATMSTRRAVLCAARCHRALYDGVVTAQPAEAFDQHDVIHLGGETAVVVPVDEYRKLRALERLAPPDELEAAEADAVLEAHREWVAAGRPGAVSHEEAMAELLGGSP